MRLEAGARPLVSPGKELRIAFGFLTYLDNLNSTIVLPILEPNIEQAWVVGFHELEAAVAVLFQPTVQVIKTLRQHPTLAMKPFVDLLFCVRGKMFYDHVKLHAINRAGRNEFGRKAASPLSRRGGARGLVLPASACPYRVYRAPAHHRNLDPGHSQRAPTRQLPRFLAYKTVITL
jgi:hypothetical protein